MNHRILTGFLLFYLYYVIAEEFVRPSKPDYANLETKDASEVYKDPVFVKIVRMISNMKLS